jgi:hypothetical protein
MEPAWGVGHDRCRPLWGHHGGTRIENRAFKDGLANEKGHEMAGLSPRDYPDKPLEAHGKEGVNGSSPLEGFRTTRAV